jgi:hypothetical protein
MKERLKLKSALKGGILLLCFAMMVGCSGSGDDDAVEQKAKVGSSIEFSLSDEDFNKLNKKSTDLITTTFTYDGPIPALYMNLAQKDDNNKWKFLHTAGATASGDQFPAESAVTLYSKERSREITLLDRPGMRTLESGRKYKIVLSSSATSITPLGYFTNLNITPESAEFGPNWEADITAGTTIGNLFQHTAGTNSTIGEFEFNTLAKKPATDPFTNTTAGDITFDGDRELDQLTLLAYTVRLSAADATLDATTGKVEYAELELEALKEAATQVDGTITISTGSLSFPGNLRNSLLVAGSRLYLVVAPTEAVAEIKKEVAKARTGTAVTVDDGVCNIILDDLNAAIALVTVGSTNYKSYVQLVATVSATAADSADNL